MASLNYTSAEANLTVRATENPVTRCMNQWMTFRNLSVSRSAIRYSLCHKMQRELELTFEGLDTTSSVKEVTVATGEKTVARDMSSITHNSDMANLMGLDLSGGAGKILIFVIAVFIGCALLALIITVFRGWWKGKKNAKKLVLPITNSTPKHQGRTIEMSGVTAGGRGTWSDSCESLGLPPPAYSDDTLENRSPVYRIADLGEIEGFEDVHL